MVKQIIALFLLAMMQNQEAEKPLSISVIPAAPCTMLVWAVDSSGKIISKDADGTYHVNSGAQLQFMSQCI